jgi:hypothetical protein
MIDVCLSPKLSVVPFACYQAKQGPKSQCRREAYFKTGLPSKYVSTDVKLVTVEVGRRPDTHKLKCALFGHLVCCTWY